MVNEAALSAARQNRKAVLHYDFELAKDKVLMGVERKSMGYKNDVDKARAIYEWIVDNTFRDPKVKGCGIGDITTMQRLPASALRI